MTGATKAWCVHFARELGTLLGTILLLLGIPNDGATDLGVTGKVADRTVVEDSVVVVREAEVLLVLTLFKEE